jgi:hypothetical protein
LAKECYSMKLDLLTNATVVDDAIRFVSEKANKSNVGLAAGARNENENEDDTFQSHKPTKFLIYRFCLTMEPYWDIVNIG